MKKLTYLCLICLFLSFFHSAYAYEIQTYENQYGKLEVYPKVAEGFGLFEQNALITSKITNTIDVAFAFNHSLKGGYLKYNNSGTWIDINLDHIEHNGVHYYVYEGWNVIPKTYHFRWAYRPEYKSGKWDLYVKLSTDDWQDYRIHLDPWWNTSYTYRRTVEIDNAFVDADLENFPILFKINDTIGDLCDGGDSIRFVSMANDTEYKYEIDKWVDGSDRLIWVKIPRIYASNKTYFNFYYNNSDAVDSQSAWEVWNNGYLAVWHMDNVSDSTKFNHHLTNQGASVTTGVLYNCYDFGAGESDEMIHGTLLDNITTWDEATYECWFNLDNDVDATTIMLIGKHNDVSDDCMYYGIHGNEPDDLYASVEGTSSGFNAIYTDPCDTIVDTWYYGAVDYKSGTKSRIYQYSKADGVLYTQLQSANCGQIRDGGERDFYVGAVNENSNNWDGLIDEVRISYVKRNASWISLSFNSTNYTTGLLNIGGETIYTEPSAEITYSNEYPNNTTTGVSLQPVVYVTLTSGTGDTMNITIYTGNSTTNTTTEIASFTNQANGTQYGNYYDAVNDSITYYWRVQVEVGGICENATYHFTTGTTSGDEIISYQTPAFEFVTLFITILGAILLIKWGRKKDDR